MDLCFRFVVSRLRWGTSLNCTYRRGIYLSTYYKLALAYRPIPMRYILFKKYRMYRSDRVYVLNLVAYAIFLDASRWIRRAELSTDGARLTKDWSRGPKAPGSTCTVWYSEVPFLEPHCMKNKVFTYADPCIKNPKINAPCWGLVEYTVNATSPQHGAVHFFGF